MVLYKNEEITKKKCSIVKKTCSEMFIGEGFALKQKQILVLFSFVTGVLIWFVVSELFFGFSANRVYTSALKKVKASAEVS